MPVWTEPSLTDTYVDVLGKLEDRADSQAKMFDDGITWTSLPTNTIRWNSSNSRFEKWNGSTWANLSTVLTDVCKTANNLSDLANAGTARTNLGLGSMALINSPVPIANGGTAATDAATARTNLGLGSIATQAANAVSITGGSLTGITGITMTPSQTIAMSGGGVISGLLTITNSADLNINTTGGDYWVYIRTNSVLRWMIKPVGLIPGAHETYDIGADGATIKDIYTNRLITSKHDFTSDLLFRASGVTYWAMGTGAKEFRPNTNSVQELGTSSFYWANTYTSVIYCNTINNKSGSSAYINYGAGVGNIQIVATNAVDVYVGGSIRWYFGSDGKLNPWAAAPDYAVSYAWSVDRDLSSNSDLAQLSNFVATMAADLVTLGIFS